MIGKVDADQRLLDASDHSFYRKPGDAMKLSIDPQLCPVVLPTSEQAKNFRLR
jgi:hypothetical protein